VASISALRAWRCASIRRTSTSGYFSCQPARASASSRVSPASTAVSHDSPLQYHDSPLQY
jgi:hypothetical protein